MKSDDILDMIGDADGKHVWDAQQVRTGRFISEKKTVPTKRIWLIAALVALLLLLIGCAAIYAEYENGFISNLLSPLYGGVQTEIVDSIGVPVGASTTVGDYTLTADAVIGDRYHIAVVYTLSRTDGKPLQEGLQFRSGSFSFGSSGGGSLEYVESEDHTKLYIVEETTVSKSLRFHRNYTVCFTDLELSRKEEEENQQVMPGQWELKFPLRYKDSSVTIPTGKTFANNENGVVYEIHKVTISPIGIHMDMSLAGDTLFENTLEVHAHIILQDGSEIQLNDWNFGGSIKSGSGRMDADFGAMYPEPIPLDSIKAVVFENAAIPITLP